MMGNWGSSTGDKAMFDNGLQGGTGNAKNHGFAQRERLFIDIAASEALKGVIGFEHNMEWGRNRSTNGPVSGGGLGSRGTALELHHAYIDWLVPQTALRLRMGMQFIANPTFVQSSPQVYSEHGPGVIASANFTPEVGLTAWWVRPYSNNANYVPGYTYPESEIGRAHV
jgi:hypothetical protein